MTTASERHQPFAEALLRIDRTASGLRRWIMAYLVPASTPELHAPTGKEVLPALDAFKAAMADWAREVVDADVPGRDALLRAAEAYMAWVDHGRADYADYDPQLGRLATENANATLPDAETAWREGWAELAAATGEQAPDPPQPRPY